MDSSALEATSSIEVMCSINEVDYIPLNSTDVYIQHRTLKNAIDSCGLVFISAGSQYVWKLYPAGVLWWSLRAFSWFIFGKLAKQPHRPIRHLIISGSWCPIIYMMIQRTFHRLPCKALRSSALFVHVKTNNDDTAVRSWLGLIISQEHYLQPFPPLLSLPSVLLHATHTHTLSLTHAHSLLHFSLLVGNKRTGALRRLLSSHNPT